MMMMIRITFIFEIAVADTGFRVSQARHVRAEAVMCSA